MSHRSNQLSAELFYRNPLRVGEPKPTYGLKEEDPERPDLTGHSALILNGRGKATSLDQEGFKLIQHLSSVSDFYDDQCVQDQYYPEIKEVVLNESGAAFVQVLSHITRSEEQAIQGKRLGAHRLVHNDFTSNLIKHGFFSALEQEGKYDIENGRICIFNLWRRFDPDGLHAPLAVCDASSVTEADLIPADLWNYGGGEGLLEICQSSHNPKHRWFYFPEMRREEVLMFKTYDSAMSPFMPTLHSAFDDPECPEKVSLRESIEVRVMCLYA